MSQLLAKVLEFQLQHHSIQRNPRADLLQDGLVGFPCSPKYDLNQIPYDYTVEVRNICKGLDLIDRVPNELWMEVRDIVQETGINTIIVENKCKKAKWLSEEALQIAVKRRQAKNKGEKERYTHLNAETYIHYHV